MYRKASSFIFFTLMVFHQELVSAQSTTPKKVVTCYIGTWAVYREGRGSFHINNLNPNLCTHIVYSFAGLDPHTYTIKSLDPWQDLPKDGGKDGFRIATSLRSTYPHLKISLAIGGWNEGSINYSKLSSLPERRKNFIASVMEFLRIHKFDGFDLDWEYPANNGGAPEDKKNFVSLVRELRKAFGSRYLLTSAIGINPMVIDTAYEVSELVKYLDFFHLMCYDYHGTWDRAVGANAPLRSSDVNDKLTVEFSVNYMLKKGVPPSKLLLGLPFYGRTFNLASSPGPDIMGAPAEGEGFQGKFSKQNGFMGYNEIALELKNSSWKQHWDENTVTPYIVNGRKVIVYDNQKSIAAKVNFAMSKDLGGVMIWSVDTDDFQADGTNNELDIYEDFMAEAKSMENTPLFHEALPLLAPIKYTTDYSRLNVSHGNVNLVRVQRDDRSYPLLYTINEMIDLNLQLKAIKDMMKKAEEENVIGSSGTRSGISLPFVIFSYLTAGAFLFF